LPVDTYGWSHAAICRKTNTVFTTNIVDCFTLGIEITCITSLPFQASARIMDLDFKIFDSERLITEVEKRPALYNKATPEYCEKHCKEILWIEVCEAVVPNWSRMDTTARVATGKSVKKHFYVHSNLFVETVQYSFIIFL